VIRLRAIPEGKITATARRLAALRGSDDFEAARRALLRIRAGTNTNVRLDTLEEIAKALGEDPLEILSRQPIRPAPIGRRLGKPRAARRQPDAVELPVLDETWIPWIEEHEV